MRAQACQMNFINAASCYRLAHSSHQDLAFLSAWGHEVALLTVRLLYQYQCLTYTVFAPFLVPCRRRSWQAAAPRVCAVTLLATSPCLRMTLLA
jgi:hypothetical protein